MSSQNSQKFDKYSENYQKYKVLKNRLQSIFLNSKKIFQMRHKNIEQQLFVILNLAIFLNSCFVRTL